MPFSHIQKQGLKKDVIDVACLLTRKFQYRRTQSRMTIKTFNDLPNIVLRICFI